MFVHVLVDKEFLLLKEIIATRYPMLFLLHKMKCNCLELFLQEHFVAKEKYSANDCV